MNDLDIFFINLPKSTFRKKLIEEKRSLVDLPSRRISGIYVSGKKSRNDFVTAPVAGCWQSHIKIYREIIKNEISLAVVLEDDTRIDTEFLKVLDTCKTAIIDAEIDILQIGYVSTSYWESFAFRVQDLMWFFEVYMLYALAKILKKGIASRFVKRIRVRRAVETVNFSRKIGIGLLRPDNFRAGTHAYLISGKFARLAANFNLEPQLFSADLFYMSLSQMCTFQIWRTCHKNMKQNLHLPSEIKEDRFKKYE